MTGLPAVRLKLYSYCYVSGLGLPPYRECAPARVEQSGGLFDQIQSEATLILSGFSGKAGGKAPGGCGKNTRWLRLDLIEVSPGHFDSGLRGLVESPPVVAQHAPCGRLLLPPATVFVFGC